MYAFFEILSESLEFFKISSMALARAIGLSGSTRTAFSSLRTSRIEGKSEATIGLAAAMYSNILSGEVQCLEISSLPELGKTKTSAAFNQRGISEYGLWPTTLIFNF